MKKLTAAEYDPEVHYVNYVPVETDWVCGARTIEDFELILMAMAEFEHSVDGCDPIKLEEGDILCIPPGTGTYSARAGFFQNIRPL